jgi:hypothetical protein
VPADLETTEAETAMPSSRAETSEAASVLERIVRLPLLKVKLADVHAPITDFTSRHTSPAPNNRLHARSAAEWFREITA